MEAFDKELEIIGSREDLRDLLFSRVRHGDSSMVDGLLEQRKEFLDTYKGPQDEAEARMLYEEAFTDFFGDCTVAGMVEYVWETECVRKCFLEYILGTYKNILVPEGGDLNPWDSQNESILKLVKDYLN